jgi:RNA polymerase sigma-70 factor (ECF subfamily)
VAGIEGFEEVLAAAQHGEEWAIAALWRALQPPLLRYLRAMCGDACEDVASDVWIESAGRLHRFSGNEAAFRGWLFTRARRRALDHHRRTAREPMAVAELPELRDPARGGEAEREQALEAAIARLRTLPVDQREVVLLRDLAGLDVGQVAAMTGRRPGTVRVLHHRALKRLAAEARRIDVTPATSTTLSGHDDLLAA